MKTFKKHLLFIAALVLLVLFAGCSKKQAITSDQFTDTLTQKGCEIHDVTQQFESADIQVVKATVAKNSNFQIEFYEIEDTEQAKAMFEGNKNKFQLQKGSNSTETSNSGSSSGSYNLNTGGKYKLLSYIDNTLVYIDADDTYKAEIQDILKELGY